MWAGYREGRMRPLIVAADLHLRHSAPEFRTDDYSETQLKKFQFILDTAMERDAVVCLAGDVFDSKDGPAWHLNRYIDLLKTYDSLEVCVVFGNHDSYYHDPGNWQRTQLGTLVLAGLVTPLNSMPYLIGDGTFLYGRSWGEEYPTPCVGEKIGKHILISHTTVTKTLPPAWLNQAVTGEQMIKMNPGFDYIVTGDFHEKFVVESDFATLINTGPMCRIEIDKADFQPSIWSISDNWVEEIMIPIESDVFADVNELRTVGGFNQEILNRFAQSMEFQGGRPTFKNMVEQLLATEKDEEVKQLAREIFDAI
jgi:predicted phosphodiesterase